MPPSWKSHQRKGASIETTKSRKAAVPPGEVVRVALVLDSDQREATFRALRGLVPTVARITIDTTSVTVEGLRPGDVGAVRLALRRLVDETAPTPPRRREPTAA